MRHTAIEERLTSLAAEGRAAPAEQVVQVALAELAVPVALAEQVVPAALAEPAVRVALVEQVVPVELAVRVALVERVVPVELAVRVALVERVVLAVRVVLPVLAELVDQVAVVPKTKLVTAALRYGLLAVRRVEDLAAAAAEIMRELAAAEAAVAWAAG
jgi:hypothetical protein